MATCSACNGGSYLPSSNRYHPCASCGGSGHGSYTNVDCMSCGGSGKSTIPIEEICWKCNGSGYLEDHSAPKKSSGNNSIKNTKNKAVKGNKTSDIASVVAFILTVLIGFIVHQENQDWGTTIVSCLIAYGISWFIIIIALHILKFMFELTKIILSIGFIGFIVYAIFQGVGGA